jgi:hypothetical protein
MDVRANVLSLSLLVLALTGCNVTPQPVWPLKEGRLAEGPVIIQRGSRFYLRYRRSIDDDTLPLYMPVYAHKTPTAACFFFGGRLSHPEWGQLIERPLVYDGFEDLARQGRVFWLDPDGTKHPILVRPDSEPHAPADVGYGPES